MIYYDCTVTLAGDAYSRRTHDSARLVRAAVDVFARMLAAHGDSFREPVPVPPGSAPVWLGWDAPEPGTAGLATFFAAGEVAVTSSVLLSGYDPAADRKAAVYLQALIRRCHPEQVEPGYDLMAIRERPVIVSVPLPWADPETMALVADMETCLAAAYFESVASESDDAE
jgi:hypothetical protein